MVRSGAAAGSRRSVCLSQGPYWTVSVTGSAAKGPGPSLAFECARTPVTVQTPGCVPAGTVTALEVPCCQLTTKPSVVDPGLRNRTSKNVFAVRLVPENVAVNELPALTVLAESVKPVAPGGLAGGVSIAVT